MDDRHETDFPEFLDLGLDGVEASFEIRDDGMEKRKEFDVTRYTKVGRGLWEEMFR